MPKEEQKPLLAESMHSSYGITHRQPSINGSNSNSTESLNSSTSEDTIIIIEENDWIDSISRYQGQTQKKRNKNGDWQYETNIIDNNGILTTIINESFIKIDGNKYWQKATHNQNNTTVEVELLNINFSKKTIESYIKTYQDHDEYISDNLNLATFQKKERNLSPENQFLEGLTIKAITGIDKFITYTKTLNEQLTLFNQNQNNNNLNILLKLYKYLTVIQNFIDDSKPTIDTSINAKFNKILKITGTSILGLIQVYIGLTGKNLQRIVSNYPIDGKDHTMQDYTNAIFWNWENYAMVLLDTALGTFFTAAASNWSRDIIFNKQNETNPFAIKQFNSEEFEKYQDRIETLLYEENHQELNKHASSIIAINNLMEKFDEIENCAQSEFEYHPNFKKETEHLKAIIKSQATTNSSEVKAIVSSANKAIKELEKPVAKPLTWKQKGYYILNDLALELSTWALSHTMISGASANTTHDDFTINDWPTYIIKQGALIANVSRYIVMRPINNIFKSGLTNLGIPTNICPKKISQWVAKQSKNAKLGMAVPLFFFITVLTNIVKTEAALVSEVGIDNSWEALKVKLTKGLTWLFFSLTTLSDMVTFAVSDFYKIFSQFNTKTITNVLTSCCKLNKEEITLLENHLIKLEKKGKLPSFNGTFTKYQEQEEDSGIEENLSQRSENSSPITASDDETFIAHDDRHEFYSNMINNHPELSTAYYQSNLSFNIV